MKIHNRRSGPTPKGFIYCGRGSPWGNPFVIGKDVTRLEAIEKFRYYALAKLEREPSWLNPLKNAIGLSCWCKPLPCHCDVLVNLIKKL